MRMAYLVSRYPAISHTFILREIRELRRRGFEIRTASINDPDRTPEKLAEEERDECKRTYYIKRSGWLGALRAHVPTFLTRPLAYLKGLAYALLLYRGDVRKMTLSFAYFVEAVMLGRWMRRGGETHLHVHFATPACTVGMIAARIFGIRYSFTVHGPDEFYDVTDYRLREKIDQAEFICCIGRYARSQILKIASPTTWPKLEVSPLGVDPAVFRPGPTRAEITTPEILCVGRLVSAKGQDVLVRAAERLANAGTAFHVTFVGVGPDEDALKRCVLERRLEPYVTFAGGVNQDAIRTYYERADVFCLPSFAEGIPVVLMEAMAMEIPCVTTNITGIPELIRHDVDGLLVMPSDDEELATQLGRLLGDQSLRERLGRAGRRRVLERYDLHRNVERLANIFARRIGGAA
ncbi:MAG: glycosyltransferase [Planctomycetes bacterium]|nr:glycosyltransferase [Planctomycetota bacterium]